MSTGASDGAFVSHGRGQGTFGDGQATSARFTDKTQTVGTSGSTHTNSAGMPAPSSSRKRSTADSDMPQQQHRPFVPHGQGPADVPAARVLGTGAQQSAQSMDQPHFIQQPTVQAGSGGLYPLPQNYASERLVGNMMHVPQTGHMQLLPGGSMPVSYADTAPKSKPTQRSSSTHPSSKTYSELYARLPTVGGEAGLISEFLRDELRSLLKANRVSYHKGGPQNLMKSKAEMAADLMQLIQEGKLQENPPPITEEEANRSHASRGKKKKKKEPASGTMAAPAPRMRSPAKWGRQSPMSPSPPPPLTPRTRAAAEIILTFPPTTPRSRQKIMEATMAEDDK